MIIVATILLIVGIAVVFWYTAKSSIKHNNRLIEWLKSDIKSSDSHWLI